MPVLARLQGAVRHLKFAREGLSTFASLPLAAWQLPVVQRTAVGMAVPGIIATCEGLSAEAQHWAGP